MHFDYASIHLHHTDFRYHLYRFGADARIIAAMHTNRVGDLAIRLRTMREELKTGESLRLSRAPNLTRCTSVLNGHKLDALPIDCSAQTLFIAFGGVI